ncbi:MAG TPA: MFS transporter [Streptosporangiaceae bacterium]|nr:MFS transporter [Streptosporangiaceae bacterium]
MPGPVVAAARRGARRARDTALRAAGGPARLRVVLTLAAVLGLSGADTGTISSTTGNLERAFHVGNTQIGLLLSVVGLVGAVFTIPAGILADRTRRTRLLGGAIVVWAAATVASGAATSYLWLLLARVGLGAATAAAGPTLASLTGDYFPASDRGRMYGLILGGDLVGSGLGYLVSGDLSSLTTWRVAFWWLAIPSLALAWVVWRMPEPARGGFSRIEAGQEEIRDERDVEPGEPGQAAGDAGEPARPQRPGLAERAVRRAKVEPQRELVLRTDPVDRPVWWAVRYVLRVRTNVVIIVASALGYFYFAGLRSFAIIFATGHYGLSKPMATSLIVVIGAGAVAGVFTGGRVADGLLRRAHVRARVLVPAVCLLALPLVLAPAIATTSVAVALPLLILGAFLLGAPNPPLDAARLDIMHPRLWGRAEAVRTVLRSVGEAAAPLAFGYVSQYIFGGPGSSAGVGSESGGQTGNPAGLEYTFLVFLVPLIAAGLLALAALRTYPRDVATASASVRAVEDATKNEEPGDQRAA